ncbi:hypothetical protein [Deinococcus arcticus]|uniref:DNA-binding protein n=1 Tax=Deinococcus arcticus TaxID=2136176 RepID=A0A2T3WAS0_9DEIO|nr:hypothetical protein [Deinococcus arcticus]PTA68999.1 hypothetical protein C8263_04155 [Deinococcus arcticus]
MTQGVDLHATARPQDVPQLHSPDDLEAVYTPAELWTRSRLPRDLIRTAIHSGQLPAYNAGRGERPRYFVRWGDFLHWRESLRVRQ